MKITIFTIVATLIVWGIFKLFFFLTGIVNPALEHILIWPFSLFIGYMIALGFIQKTDQEDTED